MLTELRRVPPGFAAFLIASAAVVTMIVLSAIDDSSVPSAADSSATVRSGGRDSSVIVLNRQYPKIKHRSGGTPPVIPPSTSDAVPLRRLVGEKLIARISGTTPSGSLLKRVRRGEVGGLILFPDNIGSAAQLRALTRQLTQAAVAGGAPGFIVAVDQEGGPVKRLRAGPPNLAPAQIATASVAAREGSDTAAYLKSLGVNVDLAPVLDVRWPGSFVASRAFASIPDRVAALGGAFASGLQQGGVAAAAKHFPGLGHATANTDAGPSVVKASRSQLDADLAPFTAASNAGVALVMMSNATYPAYGPGPAVLSRSIVQGQLRSRIGFGGVIVSDDLEAGAIRAVMPPAAASVAAADAGVDMLLLARSPGSYDVAYRSLLAAAKAGRLSRRDLEASYARIQRLQSGYPG